MHDALLIARALDELAALLSLSKQNRWKAQAYERGAEAVQALGESLGELVDGGRLTEIEGIGESLARQIAELWSTGRSSLLERLRAEHPPGTVELARLPGLTPRRREAVQQALGVTSIEELRSACLAQRVRALPGFGIKTEQRLLDAIEQRARQEGAVARVLLVDALAIVGRLERELGRAEGLQLSAVAGEVRRAAETVTHIDLVVVGEPAAAVRWLEGSVRTGQVDPERYTAQLAEGIGLRLHPTTHARAARSLLEATGPVTHVQALEAHAFALDLPLEGEALGEGALHEREAALYRTLGLPFVPPELRDAFEEVASIRAARFDDLVELADVRGMIHCHTTYSDGKNTIEEMARAADALGMQYITITDHSPSAHYAGGLTLDRLAQQWDEIAEVQERVSVRILRGTESDILADGSLDYPDHILERFDVVIASVHARFKMNRAEMTARLVRALALPVMKVWGHALGRLLLTREPFECDVDAVLDALASAGGAVEINGDPHRLDLPPAYIPLARARHVPFVLSVDAHSTRGLNVLPFAVKMARRGGVRRDEVLNAQPVDAFLRACRPAASRSS